MRQNSVSRYFSDKNWQLLDLMDQIAESKGATVSQIALAWMLNQPDVTSPIIGPRTLKQLEDNLGALDIDLNEDELVRLDEASKPV